MTLSDHQHQLATEVVSVLSKRGETVSTCESLTAGLLSATIAGVSGASAVLRGGLITYSKELKHTLAGVEMEIIESAGVVNEECAIAMAQGARVECRSTWAIALTGVAGPTEQDGHPVGEVWIAIAGPEGLIRSGRVEEDGVPDGEETPLAKCDRNTIRYRCVTYALDLLLKVVAEEN